nr:hypothetical protein Iba_chr14cCG9640 [Ipomoea batatas]
MAKQKTGPKVRLDPVPGSKSRRFCFPKCCPVVDTKFAASLYGDIAWVCPQYAHPSVFQIYIYPVANTCHSSVSFQA